MSVLKFYFDFFRIRRILITLFFLLSVPILRAQNGVFKLTDTSFEVGDSCYIYPDYSLHKSLLYYLPELEVLCDSIRTFLEKNPTVVIQISNHTDHRDILEINDTICIRRLIQIQTMIESKNTIQKGRIILRPMGEREPFWVTQEIHNLYTFLPVGQQLTEGFIDSITDKRNKEIAHGLNRRSILTIISKQPLTKFLEIFNKSQDIPNGLQFVTIDQMHSSWQSYLEIPSPNYFEHDLNGDKIIDFVFILIDTNLSQSKLCCFLSEKDGYKFHIIDTANTYEQKNQIIIFPEKSKLLKTEYETYKLKNGGINSIFLWDSLEFTYYWTGHNFEKIMFD